MASSESEGDYQSADEDIDFEDDDIPTDTKLNVADERKTIATNVEDNASLTVEENHTANDGNTVTSKAVEENSYASKTVETISVAERTNIPQSSTTESNYIISKEPVNLKNVKERNISIQTVEKNSIPQSCTTVSNDIILKEVINLKVDEDLTSKVEETASVKDKCKEIEENSESDQGLLLKGAEDTPAVNSDLVNKCTEEVVSNRKPRQTRSQKPREQKPKASGMKKLGVKIETNSESSSAQPNLNSKTVNTSEVKSPQRIVQDRGFAPAPRKVQCWEEGVNSPTQEAVQETSAPLSRNCDEESEPKKYVNELEKIDSVLDRISSQSSNSSAKSSWGGWSGWGVSSLLSTATESVSTLTSQVSHGLSSVLETGLGVPNPEELARMDLEKTNHSDDKVDEDKIHKDQRPENSGQKQTEEPGLFNLGLVMTGVSSIGKLVETAGTKVLTGGLDTLETMGKKTMEVLQEGDPGLKKKRAFFTGEKVVLSQVLQEAKERAEYENREKEDREALRQAHFETLFDDFQGLVHLEALEMLSKKCEMKLEGELFLASGEDLVELQNKVDELKNKCTLPEDDDDDDGEGIEEFGWQDDLLSSAKQLEVQDSLDKMINSWRDVETWLDSDHSELSCREIHIKTMSTLAQLTAEAVKHFHKSAELIAVKTKRNPLQEAEIFCSEALHVSKQLRCLAARFSKLLDSIAENNSGSTSVNELITSIFLEASNSSSYIRQAFQLLIPVIQVGVIT